MQIPKEFAEFGVRVDQDSLYGFASLDDAIRAAIQAIGAARAAVVREYLDQVISQPHTNEELSEIWRRSRSGFYIAGPHLIEFFKNLRAAFD